MNENGKVYETLDGGVNWIDLSGTYGGIKMVAFNNYLYVTATAGKLWRRALSNPVGVKQNVFIGYKMSIYPNPSADVLYVNHAIELENAPFAIYTVDGKLLYEGLFSGSSENIKIKDFPAGMYILRVLDAEAVRFVKM